MTDKEIYTAVRAALLAGLEERGFTGVAVRQARQPQTHGAIDGPALFMFEVSQIAYGYGGITEAWDDPMGEMTQTTTQRFEFTMQITAWMLTDAAAGLTTGDLIRAARESVQSPQAVASFRAAGAQVLRVRDIRATPSPDDRGQWRTNPSFDLTLAHLVTHTRTIPSATVIGAEIHRV